jgi:hypothetical protein
VLFDQYSFLFASNDPTQERHALFPDDTIYADEKAFAINQRKINMLPLGITFSKKTE